MSNNLVSQQLLIQSMQMGQLEPIVHTLDSSGRDLQMEFLGPISSGPMSQQQATPNDHVGLLRSMSANSGSQGLTMSMMQSGQVGSHMSVMGMHQLFVPNKQSMQMETMLNRMAPQQMPTIPKRKAPVELLSSVSVASKKRVAQMEHRPWLQQVSSTSDKGALQMQPLSNSTRLQHFSAPSKRKTQMEFMSNKSGTPRILNSRGQNAQAQQSFKVQTESSESVRSKMRESLTAALALVWQQDKPQVGSKNASNEATSAQGKLENISQCAGSESADLGQRLLEISQSDKISSAATDSVGHVTGEHRKTSTSHKDYFEKCTDGETVSVNISNNENILSSMLVTNCDNQDFQSSYTLTTDDVPFSDNFFVKDDLLQGNGLSWVLDSGIVDIVTQKETQTNEEQKSQPEEVSGDCREHQSPELLALRIESELFKLFGGVNKKYKEKGRSLLFNLKDRNNPELRERVMSGEIPPERLCSMTAEELASKELSQWRIAKAEELAQMVVLHDSDVDIRRLVKKTHKGEFQVEVEHEDNVPVELPGGANSVAQSQTNKKDVGAASSKPDGINGDTNTDGDKSNVEKDSTFTLTIPSNDGTDPMQGLMTDDALKDAEFLPPIVSLDEFMESLHSEPPFEDLPVESEKQTPISDKESSEVGSQSKSSDTTPSDNVDGTSDKSQKIHNSLSNVEADLGKGDNAKSGAISSDAKCSKNHAGLKPADGKSNSEVRSTDDVKSGSNHAELRTSQFPAEERYGGRHVNSKIGVHPSTSKHECVWEGMLQLNISTTHSVISIFKSGMKTSVKDWPALLEIKGRVRLDAFEKFLQELHLSRTRAIMVLHFVSKEESPKNEKSTLREVADSYILDERVGFAEPMPRVELYFCPPHKKTVEMLSKILPKEQIKAVNDIDCGLIGIIVWRKLTSISPTSSTHPKLSSKNQYLSTRRQQDTNVNANANANLTPKAGPPTGFMIDDTGPPSDDDDIPPGFGPAVAREEDDLPEFKFSSSSNPSNLVQKYSMGLGMAPFHSVNQTQSRPVEQMRELIHKYGQNKLITSSGNWQDKFGATIQPWTDDDDDIPEWQPQNPQNQLRPQQQQPMFNSQLRPHMLNQPYAVSPRQAMMPMRSLQPPMNVTQGQRNLGPSWVPPNQGNKLHPSNFICHPSAGQPTESAAWHQNVSRSRGF